jgi:RimJ/RimL family protein N-acetyltransferase
VIFVVDSRNIRSQRAVEKIGAARVGSKPDPQGRESFIYRITRPVFEKQSAL